MLDSPTSSTEASSEADADLNSPSCVLPSSSFDVFEDFLSLIDLEKFTLLDAQHDSFRSNVGISSPAVRSQVIGQGGSYTVRREPIFKHSIKEQSIFPVLVIKQPRMDGMRWNPKEDDAERLRAVLTELRIVSFPTIQTHPNIVRSYGYIWDSQNQPQAIAPSLLFEYADLGTLGEFLDQELRLHAVAKREICDDIAKGLQCLHECAIVHGDLKFE
jgi:hypothetical protein